MAHMAGTNVKVVIDLTNPKVLDDPVAGADFRVMDENGVTVMSWTDLATVSLGATIATVTVPAEFNELPSGVRRAAREVELLVTTAGGQEYLVGKTYILTNLQSDLRVGENTLMTLAGSDLEAHGAPDLKDWQVSARDDKEACLKEAYRRILCLPFLIEGQRRNLSTMTKEELLAIDSKVLEAIKKAQIVEAANIMSGEQDDREDGVILETIGQVKKMFGKTKKLDLGVCKKAFAYIAPYVDLSARKVTRS